MRRPLRLNARRVAVGAEQAAALERRERAAIAGLADAVEDDVEPARQDAREVFALVVDRRGAKAADQRRVRATRGAPQLEAGKPAEYEQRLADGAGGAMHEHALGRGGAGSPHRCTPRPWDVLLACQGQLRLAPSGHIVGIDMHAALSLARAREHDLAVLSELLPAAEAGLVEAVCSDRVRDDGP